MKHGRVSHSRKLVHRMGVEAADAPKLSGFRRQPRCIGVDAVVAPHGRGCCSRSVWSWML